MTKLAHEWVRTSDPVIRSPARYRWTTAPTIITAVYDTCVSCNIHLSLYRVSQKKKSPLTKYNTTALNREINEIHFRDIDPDVHADTRYKNSIDRSRNV